MADITLGSDDPREEGKLALTIDGTPHFFEIATDKVSARLLTTIPQRALDLLDIAGTVFAADSALPRGGNTRSDFGAGWRRNLHFHIPVREPEFWSRADVTEALTAATEFMTDDHVDFEFTSGGAIEVADLPRLRPLVGLCRGRGHPVFRDRILWPASSRSWRQPMRGSRSLTHRSAQKRMPHQNWLAARLKQRFPGRILWIPIKARRSAGEASETTQRSRPLLFAALGFLVSHILGTRQLLLFENGVVSQNLPISPQVIGSLATRTTHPLVIHRLRHLLQLVAEEPFELSNPYTWLTKTQVVSRLRGPWRHRPDRRKRQLQRGPQPHRPQNPLRRLFAMHRPPHRHDCERDGRV